MSHCMSDFLQPLTESDLCFCSHANGRLWIHRSLLLHEVHTHEKLKSGSEVHFHILGKLHLTLNSNSIMWSLTFSMWFFGFRWAREPGELCWFTWASCVCVSVSVFECKILFYFCHCKEAKIEAAPLFLSTWWISEVTCVLIRNKWKKNGYTCAVTCFSMNNVNHTYVVGHFHNKWMATHVVKSPSSIG